MRDSKAGKVARRVSWFLAVIQSGHPSSVNHFDSFKSLLGDDTCLVTSRDKRVQIVFLPCSCDESPVAYSQNDSVCTFILGDPSEVRHLGYESTQGNAAMLTCDFNSATISALSSITGLPPIFVYEYSKDTYVLTSALHLLANLHLGLRFEPLAVVELATIGYPVGHRTLFKGIKLLKGGCRMTFRDSGEPSISQAWTLPIEKSFVSVNEHIEQQIECFSDAFRRLNLENAFFSLTGGLDTRVMMALLVRDGRHLPVYTLTGERPTLDAIAAKALSDHYGWPYQSISLDTQFRKNLPSCTLKASMLSGGISGFEDSCEVYYYEAMPTQFDQRLVGFLGNQLGRGGVERLKDRRVDMELLGNEITDSIYSCLNREQWWLERVSASARNKLLVLLQEEVCMSNLASYSIGTPFSVQVSPYASRDFIELAAAFDSDVCSRPLSRTRMRLMHVRHNFWGEPWSQSFQRQLISRVGGYVSNHPINWGWIASGGISFSAFLRGVLACLDCLLYRCGKEAKRPSSLFPNPRFRGTQEFRHYRRWLREDMKEFILDMFRSASVLSSGMFNQRRIEKIIKQHFNQERCHYDSIVFATDLAIARDTFGVSV